MNKKWFMLFLLFISFISLSAQDRDTIPNDFRKWGVGVSYMDYFGIGFCSKYRLDNYSFFEGVFGVPEPGDGLNLKFNISYFKQSKYNKHICFGLGYQFRKYSSQLSNGVRITNTSSILFGMGYLIDFGRLTFLPKIGVGPFIYRNTYDKNIDPNKPLFSGTYKFSNEEIDPEIGVRINYMF